MSYSGNKNVKEQLEYSDILFKQIDRIGMIVASPNLNINQFSASVDILAGMVSFLKKFKFESIKNAPDNLKYKDTMAAFERIIKALDDNGLLFKYRIRGNIGGGE